MAKKSNKAIIIWLLVGCFMIFAMVIIGGITRLTQSGLSMVDWQLFMGAIPPMSQEAWLELFKQYQTSPEFQQLNSGFTLNDFKSIFWWEYIHRMWGRLIGVVFIVPFAWFLIKKQLSKPLLIRLVVLLFLGGFQGFLGWFMVKSGLKDVPHVSHYRLAAHLITAFLAAGYAWWLALDLFFANSKTNQGFRSISRLAKVLFGVVIVQIIYGAFVAGLKAGVYYPTWPKMGEQWFPGEIVAMDPVWMNFLEGIPGVQFLHRYIAVVVVVLVAVMWIKARNLKLQYSQRFALNTLALVVFAQFYLGVLTIINVVPIYLGVLHQAGAFFLFCASVLALHRFANRQPQLDA